jgi:hypothetical protein
MQQGYGGGGFSMPSYMPMDGNEIGIIKEMSSKKVLEQLRMKLKGYEFDYEKNDYIKITDPLMNDKGISKYLSIMSSVITDLVTFSNYKDNEINNLTMYVYEKAVPTIHINYKDYGIKDKSDLQIIDIQILTLTLSAFKKAVGSGDRNVVRGVISENISNPRYGDEMGGGGFLSRFNPFRRSR